MAEEIDFENGRNSNFEGLVTLTLTFDPAIRHIVLQQSSTSTYIPNFIQIEETFCGRTDVRTDIFPLYTIRSTFGSRPKNGDVMVWKLSGKHYCIAIHLGVATIAVRWPAIHLPINCIPRWIDYLKSVSEMENNQLTGTLLLKYHWCHVISTTLNRPGSTRLYLLSHSLFPHA